MRLENLTIKALDKRAIDISGLRFGRLLVIGYAGSKDKGTYWNCLCDCGGTALSKGASLRSGAASSCGCLRKERAAIATRLAKTTHGKTAGGNQRVYRIWTNMMSRCYNEKFDAYRWYGARGIKVCQAWHSFAAFLADMGEPPTGLTIDRIDNDGDYKPGNCRWATMLEQAGNKRQRKAAERGITLHVPKSWGDAPC